MAIARTTLSAAITATQIQFAVASTAATGFPAVGAAPLGYQPLWVDDECMFLVSVPVAGQVIVRSRGAEGTEAIIHDLGSTVVTTPTPAIDFPANAPGQVVLRPVANDDIITQGTATGAITIVPGEFSQTIFLAPTTGGVWTFAAPSLVMNGQRVTFTSQVALAHTITVPGVTGSTGLYNTGATGGPFTIMTFPAFIGASVTLEAQNGSWNVLNASISPVTFT
jgi:hypothetical protein